MKAPKNQINMDTVYFADSYRDKVYEVYGELHAKKYAQLVYLAWEPSLTLKARYPITSVFR